MGVIDTVTFVVVNGFIFGSLLALTAVGLSLIFGVMDVPNFAQGEFATLAGFVTIGLMDAGLGLLQSAAVALATAFAAGVATERLVVSKFYGREHFLLLTFFATFGLTIISESVLRKAFGGFRHIPSVDLGTVTLLGTNLNLLRVAAGGIAVMMLLALYLFTRYTFAGLAMRAVANDREGASIAGVNHERIYLLTFGVGAVLTGVSGILYGMVFTLYPTLGVRLTAFAFTIVVVGGVGSFSGTIAASLLIGVLDSATATYVGSRWRFFVVFAVLFLVLTLRPSGLWGETNVRY